MESVIVSYEKRQNALLESPTGTGKTLSLLCSSLAWLENKRKNKVPGEPLSKILYLSRTHSQLAQVIKELKKTAYRPIATTLGSRDQMCINEEALKSKGGALNIVCKQLRKYQNCEYFKNKNRKAPLLNRELMDIEDLCDYGKHHSICPFFMVRDAIESSELLLLPYNYLLDPKIRTMYKDIEFQNSIIIFDEAHNVSRVSEDTSSFETSIEKLTKCLDELAVLRDMKTKSSTDMSSYEDVKKELDDLKLSEIEGAQRPIHAFAGYLKDWPAPGKDGTVMEGRKLFDIFNEGTAFKSEEDKKDQNKLITQYTKNGPGLDLNSVDQNYSDGVTLENNVNYMHILDKCVQILAIRKGGAYLLEWYRIIETVYYYMAHDKIDRLKNLDKTQKVGNIEDFKVIICQEDAENSDTEKLKFPGALTKVENNRELKVFCFNPGIGFMEIMSKGPRSILLTSGTLSPMDSLEKELRIQFPIKLENKHVIDLNQVSLNYVAATEKGSKFIFDYSHRSDEAQIAELGQLIKNTTISTPGGVLVFFSSYSVLNMCYAQWKNTVTSELRSKYKIRSFREEKSTAKNTKVLNSFKYYVKNGSPAILYSVCRGKISEGLDFCDEAARTVIMIGIPFPAQFDKRVVLKKEYLDRKSVELKISGQIWYTQEALRAVNQAIGRVIRHKNDYGAILLVDCRYNEERLRCMLSKWLREIPNKPLNTSACVDRLKTFFKEQEERTAKKEESKSVNSDTEKILTDNPETEEVKKPTKGTATKIGALDAFLYRENPTKKSPTSRKRYFNQVPDHNLLSTELDNKKPKENTEYIDPLFEQLEELKCVPATLEKTSIPKILTAEGQNLAKSSENFGLKSEKVNIGFTTAKELENSLKSQENQDKIESDKKETFLDKLRKLVGNASSNAIILALHLLKSDMKKETTGYINTFAQKVQKALELAPNREDQNLMMKVIEYVGKVITVKEQKEEYLNCFKK